MAGSGGLRVGLWLDLAADLMSAPVTAWPAETVVGLLIEEFDSPAGAFYLRREDGSVFQEGWPAAVFAAHHSEIMRWGAEEARHAHPLLRYYLATGDPSPRQIADVPARFADRRVHDAWRDWARHHHPVDVSAQLAIPVGLGPVPSTSFLVGRDADFTDAEIDRVRRLQRLLTGLDRQISTFARWSRSTGTDGIVAADEVHLTPRELAVLELLATGRTAGAIARRLAIAERTAQKHLQRIYRKLGVTDRLGAVQRAQHVGLLPRAEASYVVHDPSAVVVTTRR